MAYRRQLWLLAALAAFTLLAACHGAELEGLDEPEPAPEPAPIPVSRQQAAAGGGAAAGDAAAGGGQAQQGQCENEECLAQQGGKQQADKAVPVYQGGLRRGPAPPRKRRDNYYIEIGLGTFFALYALCAYIGSRKNRAIAEAWARTFAAHGSILEKNFSHIGLGDKEDGGGALLTKESASQYKFYASGRRHCQGVLGTLNLVARQDLLSILMNVVMPSEDVVDMEVYMHEANMPQLVLAVGTPRQAKQLASNRADVKRFARAIKVANGELASKWNNAKLQVLAEHGSLFYDLFAHERIVQIFTAPKYADQLRYFRYLHFTSENSEGSHKRVLRFQFALPPAADMAAISALLELVPLFIDVVGIYKLTPEQKKKAVDARSKTENEAAEDKRKERVELLQQRKMEKMLEEKERLSRLPPDQRQKAEEKLARQAAKKQQRIKMVRM